MSYTTSTNGRFGNQLIRNIAVHFIARKHHLKVKYSSHDRIEQLGIDLFSGDKSYPDTDTLNETNYLDVLNADTFSHNVEPNNAYFQTKESTRMIDDFFREKQTQESIIQSNPFRDRYDTNNDCFMHIRLGDVTHLTPGVHYYLTALSQFDFDHLFIASDSPNHRMVNEIREKYPKSTIVTLNEVMTIQFGSTCRHLILSNGSFSAVIGYLGFWSSVYHPEYYPENAWHGDLFSIDGWHAIPHCNERK